VRSLVHVTFRQEGRHPPCRRSFPLEYFRLPVGLCHAKGDIGRFDVRFAYANRVPWQHPPRVGVSPKRFRRNRNYSSDSLVFSFFSPQDALDSVQPGDTIELGDGHYWEDLRTRVSDSNVGIMHRLQVLHFIDFTRASSLHDGLAYIAVPHTLREESFSWSLFCWELGDA